MLHLLSLLQLMMPGTNRKTKAPPTNIWVMFVLLIISAASHGRIFLFSKPNARNLKICAQQFWRIVGILSFLGKFWEFLSFGFVRLKFSWKSSTDNPVKMLHVFFASLKCFQDILISVLLFFFWCHKILSLLSVHVWGHVAIRGP